MDVYFIANIAMYLLFVICLTGASSVLSQNENSAIRNGSSNMCVLPPYPKHGSYSSDVADAAPGQVYPQVALQVTCQRGYDVEEPYVQCYSGVWTSSIPKCVRECQLDPHPSVEYRCQMPGEDGYRSCRRQEPSGTLVSPRCRTPNYYSASLLAFMRCADGYWNYIARCTLECGRVTPEQALFFGEWRKRGELPWHTGVYDKQSSYKQVCAGSLISKDIVISAAHCFWSEAEKQLPASRFAVAVGKLYMTWDSIADDVQKADVQGIQVPRGFQGGNTNGIAVVIVARAFEFNTFVRPVCLDFDAAFERRQLTTGTKGRTAGWRLTTQNASAALQVVELPYLEVSTCVANSPPDFTDYITSDKICAGTLATSYTFCDGDRGGGLTFPETDGGTKRYYLRGVLSAPNEGCTDTYAVFTQINKHGNFIEQWTDNPDASPSSLSFKSTGICILPPYPEHGSYVSDVFGAEPGQGFDQLTVNVTCQRGYGVFGHSSAYCRQGVWQESFPKCVRMCQLSPHPSVEYRCLIPGTEDSYRACRRQEPSGSIISPQCRTPNYYSTTHLSFMRCIDGYWNYIAKCNLECGRVTPEEVLFSGMRMRRGELPWHAEIYKNGEVNGYKLVCGGSLISNDIVISAGQCFWGTDGLLPVTRFAVAVGKLFRAWNSKADEVQKADVREIQVPPGYQGVQKYYQDDIAVVIVARAFEFNTFVRPVCLDFDAAFERRQLTTGTNGKVAVWRSTENTSVGLQALDLPYLETSTCIQDIPDDYKTYITSDKICAGNLESKFPFCEGDSGGGLAFPEADGGNERYYLRGVLSAPSIVGCTETGVHLFTHIRTHHLFVRQWTDNEGAVSSDLEQAGSKCVLPSYPKYGTYKSNVPGGQPGQESQLLTVNVTCQRGYAVLGSSFIYCVQGTWSEPLPKCVSVCELNPHPSVEYRCQLEGTDEGYRPCRKQELHGTKVKPECRRPNYYSATNLILMRCKDGHWNYIARCTPECGRVTPEGAELVVGGAPVERGEIPWHAGIYRKQVSHRPSYQQVCGGSLISNTIVISAAHCFWSDVDKQLAASLFAVAVGKIYRSWNHPEDETQKSEVKQIGLPPRFQGAATNFQDDLAVVVVARAFEYKTFIRPVCLSFDVDIERMQLPGTTKGKVAGWGLTSENGVESPTLQVIELPYVEVATCLANLPFSFREYITSDKICAGIKEANSGLCKGDSGGGLAFPVTDRGTLRYYLHGVVSTAPNDDNVKCNTATYTAFTHIMKHGDFINEFLTDL